MWFISVHGLTDGATLYHLSRPPPPLPRRNVPPYTQSRAAPHRYQSGSMRPAVIPVCLHVCLQCVSTCVSSVSPRVSPVCLQCVSTCVSSVSPRVSSVSPCLQCASVHPVCLQCVSVSPVCLLIRIPVSSVSLCVPPCLQCLCVPPPLQCVSSVSPVCLQCVSSVSPVCLRVSVHPVCLLTVQLQRPHSGHHSRLRTSLAVHSSVSCCFRPDMFQRCGTRRHSCSTASPRPRTSTFCSADHSREGTLYDPAPPPSALRTTAQRAHCTTQHHHLLLCGPQHRGHIVRPSTNTFCSADHSTEGTLYDPAPPRSALRTTADRAHCTTQHHHVLLCGPQQTGHIVRPSTTTFCSADHSREGTLYDPAPPRSALRTTAQRAHCTTQHHHVLLCGPQHRGHIVRRL